MLRIVAVVHCLLFTLIAPAAGQKWPERTVRIVVPYNAGGGTDLVARLLAQALGAKLGQSFIVENRPGASGMIGAQVIAKAIRFLWRRRPRSRSTKTCSRRWRTIRWLI